MKNQKSIIIIFLISLCLIMPIVFGAIVEVNQIGEWDICEYPNFADTEIEYENNGRVNYTTTLLTTLQNGDGYYISNNITIEGSRTYWYWFNGVKRFYFVLNLKGTNAESINSWFYIAHEHGILVNTTQILVGNSQYDIENSGLNFLNPYSNFELKDLKFEFQIVRLSDTSGMVQYKMYVPMTWEGETIQQLITTYNETFTVNVNFWTNPICEIYLGHDGVGTFNVLFQDDLEVIEDIPLFVDDTTDITENPNNPFQWIIDFGSMLVGLITFLLGLIQLFIPYIVMYIPIFIIFYIIDVVYATVQTGSIQPIGFALEKAWSLLMTTFTVIIAFGALIWDTITFWN